MLSTRHGSGVGLMRARAVHMRENNVHITVCGAGRDRDVKTTRLAGKVTCQRCNLVLHVRRRESLLRSR